MRERERDDFGFFRNFLSHLIWGVQYSECTNGKGILIQSASVFAQKRSDCLSYILNVFVQKPRNRSEVSAQNVLYFPPILLSVPSWRNDVYKKYTYMYRIFTYIYMNTSIFAEYTYIYCSHTQCLLWHLSIDTARALRRGTIRKLLDKWGTATSSFLIAPR